MMNEINEMQNVSYSDMRKALDSFGIEKDAIILTHSSLKACGNIEGGAEGVISAIEETVPDGTLVFPTLSQRNWSTVYQDWNLNRPSEVGLISETFRTQKGSLRSDNATHSVAIRGKDAEDIISGPNDQGERYGIFGDYCFGHYSTWQKIYESRERYNRRAYVLFWGVSMRYNTYKHLIEYIYVEEMMSRVKDEKLKRELFDAIAHYPVPAGTLNVTKFWPFYNSHEFQNVLLKEGIAKKVKLGNSDLLITDIYDMVNRTLQAMYDDAPNMLADDHQPARAWVEKLIKATEI